MTGFLCYRYFVKSLIKEKGIYRYKGIKSHQQGCVRLFCSGWNDEGESKSRVIFLNVPKGATFPSLVYMT